MKSSTSKDSTTSISTSNEPFFRNRFSEKTTSIQKKCEQCEQEEHLEKNENKDNETQITRKPIFDCDAQVVVAKSNRMSHSLASLEEGLNTSTGQGAPLTYPTRRQMETAFGSDFGKVRIHTSPEAVNMSEYIGAQAFTHGSDIYFNEGKYDPFSSKGKHLLAHELTHTIQQAGTTSQIQKNEAPEEETVVTEEVAEENGPIPYTCDQLADLLKQIFRQGYFHILTEDTDPNQDKIYILLDRVSELLKASPLKISASQKERVEERLYDLLNVEANLHDSTFDLASIIPWLQQYLLTPPEVKAVGGVVSYGVNFLINQLSEHASYYLAGALFDHLQGDKDTSSPCYYYDTAIIQSYFNESVGALGDPYGLLELELHGSIDELVYLRYMLNSPENTPQERIRIGSEIGRISRYILLLSQALEPLRKLMAEEKEAEQAEDQSVLEVQLEDSKEGIERIRRKAESEDNTLRGLGNNKELLQDQNVNLLKRTYFSDADKFTIIPDQAFPHTTDEATLRMMESLSSHLDQQGSIISGLKNQVIPSSPTYSLDEFEGVYQQWFAFFSPAARDNDPFYQQMDNFITQMYGILGYAGVEGGIGKWLIMEMLQHQISGLGEASADFSDTINDLNPKRNEYVSGDAKSANYSVGELFSGTYGGRNAGGETTSREQVIAREKMNTTEEFNQIRQDRAAGYSSSPVYLLPKSEHQQMWSYLITTKHFDPFSGDSITIEEQKVIPETAARYLLAQTQYYRSLADIHSPNIGDYATRLGGIESGRAESTNKYLEGGAGENNSMRTATALRSSMGSHQRNTGMSEDQSAESYAVQLFIKDLEAYLDKYFTKNEDAAFKIGAILKISAYEHKGDKAFFQHLAPWALAKALGICLGIAAAVYGLRFIPYIGYLLQYAVSKALKRYGIAADVGSVIAIAGFMKEASDTNSFYSARQWAYLAKFTLDEMGQLLQGMAVSTAMDSFQFVKAAKNANPKTVNEVMENIEPLTKDPEIKKMLIEDLSNQRDSLISGGARTDRSDPELELIDDILLRLDANQSYPDRPIFTETSAVKEDATSLIKVTSSSIKDAQGNFHGMSITIREGSLIIRICSPPPCSAFISALDYALGLPAVKKNPDAKIEIQKLRDKANTLQTEINNKTITLKEAEPEIQQMMSELEAIGAKNPDVVDAVFNQQGASDGMPDTTTSALAELASASRATSLENTRILETESGEIITMNADAIPSGLRPGDTFELHGEQYTFKGDPDQRMLMEEGFSAKDIDSIQGQARIKETHDMGVEEGRLKAEKEGIKIKEDFNPPDQYLGIYGKGIDDIGQKGNIFYILEWKGGSSELGSTSYGTQMGDRWVGAKLAEFTIYYRDANGQPAIHPLVDQMLKAADGGRLRGRGYRTEWKPDGTPGTAGRMKEGPLAGGEKRYNGKSVRAAFEQRLAELRQGLKQ